MAPRVARTSPTRPQTVPGLSRTARRLLQCIPRSRLDPTAEKRYEAASMAAQISSAAREYPKGSSGDPENGLPSVQCTPRRPQAAPKRAPGATQREAKCSGLCASKTHRASRLFSVACFPSLLHSMPLSPRSYRTPSSLIQPPRFTPASSLPTILAPASSLRAPRSYRIAPPATAETRNVTLRAVCYRFSLSTSRPPSHVTSGLCRGRGPRVSPSHLHRQDHC